MPAAGAGIACGKEGFWTVAVHWGDSSHAIGEFQCRFKGFGESQLEILADFEAVDDDVDSVLSLFI